MYKYLPLPLSVCLPPPSPISLIYNLLVVFHRITIRPDFPGNVENSSKTLQLLNLGKVAMTREREFAGWFDLGQDYNVYEYESCMS